MSKYADLVAIAALSFLAVLLVNQVMRSEPIWIRALATGMVVGLGDWLVKKIRAQVGGSKP